MAYTGSTAAILSNYDEVLKTFYLPAVQEQLNNAKPLANLIETNETDVSGKDAKINMHYGRNTGIGARADGGALPEAGYQAHKQATVPMKYQYGRVTFSGPTIKATRDERGAYARVIDNEITGLVKDLAQEVNRQYWGCGWGVLMRWRTGTTTTMTVQKKYTGNSAGGDGFGSTFGAKYLEEQANCAVVVVATSTSTVITATVDSTELTVSAIAESADYDTVTITDAGVSSEAAGSYYIRPANMATVTASAAAAGTGRYEMMGLRGIVTNENMSEIAFYDGTDRGMSADPDPLQGLNNDTYSWWNANVDFSSTRYGAQRALTFKLFDKMFDKVAAKAGEGYGPDLIMTTRPLRREYKELAAADRRLVNTMDLDGGWKAISHNGVPLMVDDDAIDGEVYFLTSRDLQLYRMSDYEWMDKDGSVLARITGRDAYEAVLFRYAELGCTRRNSQGVLGDLAYDD